MSNVLDKVLLGDEAFTTEMEKLIRVIRHGGAGNYKGKNQFTYPELKEIANDGDFFDYFEIGDILTPSKETGVSVVSSNSGLTVTISEETFLTWLTDNVQGVAKRDYELIYDGSEWHLHDEDIVLANMGVTISSGTPVADDKIVIHEAADKIYFRVVSKLSDGHAQLFSVFPVLTGAQFCAAQKLHVFSSGLAAGTYKFSLLKGSYGGSTGADGAYVFTSTVAIPNNGWLRLDGWGFWKSTYSSAQFLSDTKVKTYDASGNVLETITPVAFTDQTCDSDLGNYSARKDQYSSAEQAYKNSMEKQGAGSNEYINSAIDQWLNTDKLANNWWEARDVFDVKPNFANVNGFLHGLDEEFYECIRKADVYTKGETVYENRAAQTLKRKFYLLSEKEIGFTVYGDEGEKMIDYYKQFGNATNSAVNWRIIKTQAGSAQYVWTRSAIRGNANYVYFVYTSGALNDYFASYSRAVVPACEI